MHHTVVTRLLHRHASTGHTPRITLSAISQWIELRRDDQGRGHVCQTGCSQGDGVGVVPVGFGWQILLPEPVHVRTAHLSAAQLKKGVICASAGNHALGVALGAHRLGARAVIVMPVTTPQVKVDAVKALGGEVILHGDSYSDAHLHAVTLEKKSGLTFVHPFDDPDVIAGQGTIAMEILRQIQAIGKGALDAVFVAIGGGGLISGVANYIKAVRPEIKVIGVQMSDSNAMALSVGAGKRITLPEVGLFADGTAVKLVGEETFRISRELVDEFITVDTDVVCAAIKDVFIDTRSIVEPSGTMSVAAIKQYVTKHKTRGETYAAI